MRLRARLLWVFALLVFPVGGCNEVTDPTTAALALTVTEGRSGEGEMRSEGVQVCELDSTSNCAMSDSNGEVILQLPIGETGFTLQKKDRPPYLAGIVLPATGNQLLWAMGEEQYFVDQHENMMSPFPMRGTGTVSIELGPRLAGATFELLGATGRAFYSDEGWNWSPDLAATTFRGEGGFVEVSEGDFRVKLGGAAEGCIPGMTGWPDDDEDTVRFPVRENYLNWVIVRCPLQP